MDHNRNYLNYSDLRLDKVDALSSAAPDPNQSFPLGGTRCSAPNFDAYSRVERSILNYAEGAAMQQGRQLGRPDLKLIVERPAAEVARSPRGGPGSPPYSIIRNNRYNDNPKFKDGKVGCAFRRGLSGSIIQP